MDEHSEVICMLRRMRAKRGFTLIELLVVISIILILVSFVVPQIGGARAKARKAKCLNNLRVIGSALLMYADQNGGQFPADLSALYPGYIGDPMVFDCPSTAAEPTYDATTVSSGDYVYTTNASNRNDEYGGIVAADATGAHSGGKVVLYASGSVRFVESGDLGNIDLTEVTDPVGT